MIWFYDDRRKPQPTAPPIPTQRRDLFGHPRALTFLFTTEMWERFSYYGMRALLVLYMVKYLLQPAHADTCSALARSAALEASSGRSAPQPFASQIYGLYTGLVYLTPFFGGLLADRVLGRRRTVIIGAALMAIGHFMMAFENLFLFALASSSSATAPSSRTSRPRSARSMRPATPPRPRLLDLLCRDQPRRLPGAAGLRHAGRELGWHYGFAAAGVGMTIGLVIYLLATPTLPQDSFAKRQAAPASRSTATAWQSIGAHAGC